MWHHSGMSSGQLRVRMPPALHEQLVEEAARQGVSLNQLIVALLAGGVGFKLDR
jgi:predicted HicB family RNase H-like nuclease